MSAVPIGTFAVDVLPASVVAALGMSLAHIPAMMAAMSGAPQEQAGLASGIVNTTYQVGSAMGLAALIAVATSQGAGRAICPHSPTVSAPPSSGPLSSPRWAESSPCW